ncbi:MAG: hypothetical protein ACRESW_05665, partial [Nevskiales bacterium]
MDDLQQARRAALQRAFDQRSSEEADAQRGMRALRIALDAAEAPAWPGEVVALMQPAPAASREARWAMDFRLAASGAAPAGTGPRSLIVVAVGPVFGYPQVREYAVDLLAELAASQPAAGRLALALPGLAHGLDEGASLEHLLLGLVDALAAQATPPALRELVLLEPDDARRRMMAEKLGQLLGPDAAPLPPGWVARPQSWPLVYFPVVAGAQRLPAPFEQHLTYQDTLTAFVAMPFIAASFSGFWFTFHRSKASCMRSHDSGVVSSSRPIRVAISGLRPRFSSSSSTDASRTDAHGSVKVAW